MHWIKYIRVTIGLSQSQLAMYLSVSRSLAGHLENGKRNPTLKMIEKLMYLHRVITENNLADAPATHADLPPVDHTRLIRTLTNRADTCTLSAERLNRKLGTSTCHV